jgi:hypothetical protein
MQSDTQCDLDAPLVVSPLPFSGLMCDLFFLQGYFL